MPSSCGSARCSGCGDRRRPRCWHGADRPDATARRNLRPAQGAPFEPIREPARVRSSARRGRTGGPCESRLAMGVNWHDLDLIVERGNGRPCDLRRVSLEFSETAKLAGFDLTFHGLRHGFASLQLPAGTDIKVTSGLLGHRSSRTPRTSHSRGREGLPPGRPPTRRIPPSGRRREIVREQSVTNRASATMLERRFGRESAGQPGGGRGTRTHKSFRTTVFKL